jgi:hypothetical protein
MRRCFANSKATSPVRPELVNCRFENKRDGRSPPGTAHLHFVIRVGPPLLKLRRAAFDVDSGPRLVAWRRLFPNMTIVSKPRR